MNFSHIFCNKAYLSHWSLGAMENQMSNINICKSSFSGPQIAAFNRECGEQADLELELFLMFHGVLVFFQALQFYLLFFFPLVRYPPLHFTQGLFLSHSTFDFLFRFPKLPTLSHHIILVFSSIARENMSFLKGPVIIKISK